MILRTLKLTNFRNLTGEFDFKNGLNVVIGPNGVGKTNLLEALAYISSGKSFRTNSESSVINHNSAKLGKVVFSRLEGVLADGLGNEITPSIFLEKISSSNGNGCRKILTIHGKRTISSKFVKNLYSINFSPNTIDLVTGSPAVRRRDLDDFLSVYDSEYFKEIFDYKKVIRNRNKLLERCREGSNERKELAFWNIRLIELGAKIIYKRMQFFKEIGPMMLSLAPKVFNLEDINLVPKYESKFTRNPSLEGIKSSLKKKIYDNGAKEIQAGVSLYGPHREDFNFLLDGYELREFGSRGQQRLCAFLYKIAEWHMLREISKTPPVLLLDDLFSELDDIVHEKIQQFLLGLEGQIVFTAFKTEELEKNFLTKANRILL